MSSSFDLRFDLLVVGAAEFGKRALAVIDDLAGRRQWLELKKPRAEFAAGSGAT